MKVWRCNVDASGANDFAGFRFGDFQGRLTVQNRAELARARRLEVLDDENGGWECCWEAVEKGTEDPSLRTMSIPQWHQFFRIWYRA